MIHVMAVAGLSGPAVAAPVMGYDAITVFEEEEHLCIPVVRRQRPAVTEHDGLSTAPVFVIDVDVSSVFFSDTYVWHDLFLWFRVFVRQSLTQTTCDKQRFTGDPFGIV